MVVTTDQVWVVVPCYNEERRLDRRAFAAFLSAETGPTLLFVDDGSTDATRVVLEDLATINAARCRVLGAVRNRGKAEAVRLGLQTAMAAGARYVGYWDADLATPLRDITVFAALLDAEPDTEAVLGSRVRMLGREIDRFGARHLIGRFYATLASFALGLPVYDTQCGAKLFRSSPVLERALREAFRSRWAFDVELLQRLQRIWGHRGIDRIVEVPLTRWRDVGDSKVSLLQGAGAFAFLLRLSLEGTRSLPPYAKPAAAPAGEPLVRQASG